MTTLYEKRGRRYHVWGDHQEWHREGDILRVGQSRLVTCLEPGAYRYIYGVKPDAAAFVAAAQVAAHAMAEAMHEKAKYAPQAGGTPHTPEQQKLIEKFRDDMAAAGALVPTYWMSSTASEIAQAGIDAVRRLTEE